MQLAHARDDELAGFLVRETAERRVFFRKPLQAFGQFIAILLRLRFDGHGNNRLGERRRFERHVVIFVAQRVAGRDVAQTDERGDVAGINFVDVLALAALNDHEAADALAFARARIVNRVALFQLAGINAEENQLARERVCPKFERERTKFIIVARLDVDFIFQRADFKSFRAGNVQRTRQIIHDGIHQNLHAFFLERRTAQHGNEFNLASEATNRRFQSRRVNRFFLEHEIFNFGIFIGDGVNQFRERGLGAFLICRSNVPDLVIEAFVGFAGSPINCLLVDDINHALKATFDWFTFKLAGTLERQENRERIRAQFRAHIVERVFKIRADAVHLVDECDARNVIFRRLTPDGLGLRLHARDAAEHGDRAVEHAHGTLDFSGEINVTRRVNDIDAMRDVVERLVNFIFARLGGFLRPETGDGGGRDRDAAFALLFHPVGHGIAVVHVADLVDEAGVKKNALGRSRLARVNVRGDADVARPFHRVLTARRVH